LFAEISREGGVSKNTTPELIHNYDRHLDKKKERRSCLNPQVLYSKEKKKDLKGGNTNYLCIACIGGQRKEKGKEGGK